MRVSFTSTLRVSLLGAALGLVACSSGGDGGGGFVAPNISTQPVTITSANEPEVTEAAIGGTSGGLAAGSQGLSVLGADGTGSNNRNVYSLLRRIVTSSVERQLQASSSASVTGVSFNESEPCFVSGSARFSGSIADPNSDSISSGDNVTVSFSSCNDGGGEVLNGSFSFRANSSVSESAVLSQNFSFNASLSFNNLTATDSIGTYAMHGGMTMAITIANSDVSFRMTGDSFYVVALEEAVRMTNFDISITGGNTGNAVIDSTYTIATTTIDGEITVDSHLEIANYAMYPHTGYIYITGGNSTQLNITVTDNTSVSVDLLVGGVSEAGYPRNVSWSNIDVEIDTAF